MRHLLLLASALIMSHAAASGDAVNEFRRGKSGLVCTAQHPQAGSELPYRDCLRVGPIAVGLTEREVERLLGESWMVTGSDGRAVTRLYPVDSPEPLKPFWLITFESGQVVGIQLTGRNPAQVLAFSSIQLGDDDTKVRDVFGEPSATSRLVGMDGAGWSYQPLPIRLEMVDGKVYSIELGKEAMVSDRREGSPPMRNL